VIQHVREKFNCRKCFGITQPPAPFHPISRGRAGPELLTQVLFAKYRAHLPLNRQSGIWADRGQAARPAQGGAHGEGQTETRCARRLVRRAAEAFFRQKRLGESHPLCALAV